MTEWISVEDELPNDNDYVLVFDVWGGMSVAGYSCEHLWIRPLCNCFMVNCITHWIPLPEPPKETNK